MLHRNEKNMAAHVTEAKSDKKKKQRKIVTIDEKLKKKYIHTQITKKIERRRDMVHKILKSGSNKIF